MDNKGVLSALRTLGDVLASRGRHYEIVAIGASGLLLLGLVARPTADVDVVALVEGDRYRLAKPLPQPLDEAQADVGAALGLGDKWLNPDPTGLLDFGLPNGFKDRVKTLSFGGLTVHLAARVDQICFKLYAAVDQGARSKQFRRPPATRTNSRGVAQGRVVDDRTRSVSRFQTRAPCHPPSAWGRRCRHLGSPRQQRATFFLWSGACGQSSAFPDGKGIIKSSR